MKKDPKKTELKGEVARADKRSGEMIVKPKIWERDIQIWLLRRGDNLTLDQIGNLYNLNKETVRQRVRIIDVRIVRGWTNGLNRGGSPTPAWVRRLRAAGALTRDAFCAYEAFNNTSEKNTGKKT